MSLFPSAFVVVSGWGVESFDVERATTGRPHLVPRDYLCCAVLGAYQNMFFLLLVPTTNFFFMCVSKGLARKRKEHLVSVLFIKWRIRIKKFPPAGLYLIMDLLAPSVCIIFKKRKIDGIR